MKWSAETAAPHEEHSVRYKSRRKRSSRLSSFGAVASAASAARRSAGSIGLNRCSTTKRITGLLKAATAPRARAASIARFGETPKGSSTHPGGRG
jgi:hypothetical protein